MYTWWCKNQRKLLILPESKLKVSLRFVGNEHPLETAFLWFCFSALPRLKFPNTEKLILLSSLRKCQKMENGQHCYSLGKRSNCSFLAVPANTVMSWKVAGFLKSSLCLLFFRELYSGIFLKHRLSFHHTSSVPLRWCIPVAAVGDVCRVLLVSLLLATGAVQRLALPVPPCVPIWEAWPGLGSPACCSPACTSPTNLRSFMSNTEAILWLCEIVLLMLCNLKTKCFLLIINSYSVGTDSLQGHWTLACCPFRHLNNVVGRGQNGERNWSAGTN